LKEMGKDKDPLVAKVAKRYLGERAKTP